MRFSPFTFLPFTVAGLLASAAPAQSQTISNNTLHSSQLPTDELLAIDLQPITAPATAPAQTLAQLVNALQVQMATLQAENERMQHLLVQQQAELAIQRGTTRATLRDLYSRLNNLTLPEAPRPAPLPTTARPQLRSSVATRAAR
jgi:TolA-binding protein